jgi:hypothetical protein
MQDEKMNPDRLLNWAISIGAHATALVKNELEKTEFPPNAYRKIVAILSLANLYGKNELELAIDYGMKNNTTATASIKSILDKKLYLLEAANRRIDNSLFNNHENLRGNIYK